MFYFWQFTYAILQNILGLVMLAIHKSKGAESEWYHNALITYIDKKNFGGVSLGMFILINKSREGDWLHDTRIHEYGHTWQCLLLGPLYYIVVALPSAIWCNCFEGYRKKNNVPYSKLYCEAWANAWGQKFSGLKQTENHN